MRYPTGIQGLERKRRLSKDSRVPTAGQGLSWSHKEGSQANIHRATESLSPDIGCTRGLCATQGHASSLGQDVLSLKA